MCVSFLLKTANGGGAPQGICLGILDLLGQPLPSLSGLGNRLVFPGAPHALGCRYVCSKTIIARLVRAGSLFLDQEIDMVHSHWCEPLVRPLQCHKQSTERDVSLPVDQDPLDLSVAVPNESNLQSFVCLAIFEFVDFAVANIVVGVGEGPHVSFCQVSPAFVVVARPVKVQSGSQADLHVVARVDVQQFSIDVELHCGVMIVGLRRKARSSVVLFVILGRDLELILEQDCVVCRIRHFYVNDGSRRCMRCGKGWCIGLFACRK